MKTSHKSTKLVCSNKAYQGREEPQWEVERSEMDSTNEKGTSILINHKVVKFKK